MNVHAIMNDKYEFLVTFDDEAIELLHQICRARRVDCMTVMREIVLGGLTMQSHLFICPIKPEDKLWPYRWCNLLNIFKLFRK